MKPMNSTKKVQRDPLVVRLFVKPIYLNLSYLYL